MVDYAADASDESSRLLTSLEAQVKVTIGVELRKQTKLLEGIEARLGKLSMESGFRALRADLAVGAQLQGEAIMEQAKLEQAQSLILGSIRDGQNAYFDLAIDQSLEQTQTLQDIQLGQSASVLATREIGQKLAEMAASQAAISMMTDRMVQSISVLESKISEQTSAINAAFKGNSPDEQLKQRTGSKDAEKFAKAFGSLSKAITSLVEATSASGNSSEQIKKFLLSFAEGIIAFSDKVDPKKMESVQKLIESFSRFAIGWSLSFAMAIPILKLSVIGAELFASALNALIKGVEQVDEQKVKSIASLVVLGRSAFLFGLSLAGFALIGRLAITGASLFNRTVETLIKGVQEGKDPKSIEYVERLLAIGRGSFLFGLSLAGFAIVAPIAIIGAGLFALTVKTMLFALSTIDDKKVEGVRNLMSLTKGIIWFAVSLALTSLVWKEVLIGAVAFAGTVALLGMALEFISTKDVKEGVGSLFKLSLGLASLGLGLLAFFILAPPEVTIHTVLSVGAIALTFFLVGKVSEEITQGAIAMAFVSFSLLTISLSLLLFRATGLNAGDGLNVAITLGLLALPFMIAGIKPISKWIAYGAIALTLAAVSLSAISIGLLIFKASEFTTDDALVLASTIGGLGVVFALAGIPLVAAAILLGSVALGVAGFSLGIISIGMMLFKKADFGEEDGENLKVALGSLVTGFLGGEIPGGILAGISYAAKLAARTALMRYVVPPMVLAAGALGLISVGLMAFKKANFNQSDAENMEYAIGSLVKAFSIVVDKKRQEELGIDINPVTMFASVAALSGLGNVVFELGRGIQSIANLEIVEYGIKDGKLVPKSVRKLNDSDFTAAGENIGRILSALAEPLAQIGMLEKEGSSGNPIFDAIFSNGYISTGIESISDLGETIANLGRGIKDFANLQIVEYGVKDGKLVPIKVTRMAETDFVSASLNIGKITGFLANEFYKIGKMEDESDGWFSDGYVTNGVEAIAGMGDNLVALAKAITAMARLEVVEHVIKDGKLVPNRVIAIGQDQLASASLNIGLILGFLASEFAKIGKMEDEGSGWFSDGMVTKGRDAIIGMGKDISSVVDAILKISTSEFTTYRVENGQLVPVSTRKINSDDLKLASENIGLVLSLFATRLASVGEYMADREDKIKLATKYLPKMSAFVGSSADALTKWSQVPDPKANMMSLTEFLSSTVDVFDPTKDRDLPMKVGYFALFSKNMAALAAAGDGLDRSAKNLERIEKSMKAIKESINGTDLKKLTTTDSLVKSLAILSKSPEMTAKALKESIHDVFERFIESLKEAVGDMRESSVTASSQAPVIIQQQAPQQITPAAAIQAQAQQSRTDVVKMVESLRDQILDGLSTIEMKVRVVNNNTF